MANPTALLLSAVKMLKHVGLRDHAWILEHAVEDVLSKQKVFATKSDNMRYCSHCVGCEH